MREQGIPQPPTEYDSTVGQGTVDAEAGIFSPLPYSYVKGPVEIQGNARLDGFANYRIEYGEGVNPGSWTQIGSEHGEQVGEGTLELWDTSGLNGLYSLRVLVTRGDGSVKEGVIQLTVDNTAPTASIIAPVEGQRYVTEDDEWVSVTADANDDWAMDRVDFYLDGRKIGASTVPPFSHRWDIELIGAGAPQTIEQTTTLEDGTVVTTTVAAERAQHPGGGQGRPAHRPQLHRLRQRLRLSDRPQQHLHRDAPDPGAGLRPGRQRDRQPAGALLRGAEGQGADRQRRRPSARPHRPAAAAGQTDVKKRHQHTFFTTPPTGGVVVLLKHKSGFP